MTTLPRVLRVGTLGSSATFAGEATQQLRLLFPEFAEPSYFPTMDACWNALADGTVDVIVLGVERTGQPNHGQAIVARGFFVLAQIAVPLGCNLYVKPGTRKTAIRAITGHGSILQCTAYLDREFPGIPREQHGKNSVEAARAVMAADGTLAVVGSRSLQTLIPELDLLEASIDDGAISAWWAITAQPYFSAQPRVLVITARCEADGSLGALVAAVGQTGFTLTTAAAFPVGRGVSIYDYLLTFRGTGALPELERALTSFPTVRLAGAFEPRSAP